MPELPEAEAVCCRIRRQAGAAGIVSAHILRPKITRPQTPADVELRLRDTVIAGVRRRGKQVLMELTNGLVVRLHLGMTGDAYVVDDHRLQPHTIKAWFRLADGRALVFNDPRVLGRLNVYTAEELEAALGGLGVEPLSDEFTGDRLRALAAGSRLPVKLFLMDQTRIAGLGNIYAAEALFRAGIHPARPIGKLRGARLQRLYDGIVNVLRDAIQSAGTAYLRLGEFQEAEPFAVQA